MLGIVRCRSPASRLAAFFSFTSFATMTVRVTRPLNARQMCIPLAGRKVYLRSPPEQCKDYNDYLNLIADRDGRAALLAQSAEDAA